MNIANKTVLIDNSSRRRPRPDRHRYDSRAGIFDGLEKREEDIYPDPASQSIAEGWRAGAVKALERQFTGFVPGSAASL
jgi:hypothetical protein